jgi:preprotein translocase subunit SecB
MAEEEQAAQQNDSEHKVVQPKKVYLKDVSFETPNSPAIFTHDWKPEIGVEINSSAGSLSGDAYEVVLTVTVTVSIEGNTAYLAEVHQAGVFVLTGFTGEELQRVQNIHCLRTLYPYACAEISDLVSKGGFPQFVLRPMNFQGLYARGLKEARKNGGGAAE